MTEYEASAPLRRLYWLTTFFGLAGFLFYFFRAGALAAFGFLLGAAASLGNLWLFHWLSHSIAPRPDDSSPRRNAWSAGLFIGRYIVFIAVGYTTVKALGVSPIPVLFGLLASTAAVLTSSLLDLARSLTGTKPSP